MHIHTHTQSISSNLKLALFTPDSRYCQFQGSVEKVVYLERNQPTVFAKFQSKMALWDLEGQDSVSSCFFYLMPSLPALKSLKSNFEADLTSLCSPQLILRCEYRRWPLWSPEKTMRKGLSLFAVSFVCIKTQMRWTRKKQEDCAQDEYWHVTWIDTGQVQVVYVWCWSQASPLSTLTRLVSTWLGLRPVSSSSARILFSPSRVSTLRGSYGKCKGRCLISVLTLGRGIFPVNFCI